MYIYIYIYCCNEFDRGVNETSYSQCLCILCIYIFTYPNNSYTLMKYKRSTEEAAIMLLLWNNVQIKFLNKKILNLVFET